MRERIHHAAWQSLPSPMPAFRRTRIGTGGAARGLVAGELDDNALRHRRRKLERVPVGQPDAAMGFRLADLDGSGVPWMP